MENYIMAIDQGTTSTRAILFDHDSRIVASDQKEFTQYFRHSGWVEHDANEIWMSVLSVMAACMQKSHVAPEQVAAIGITNQRETTVVWNKETGLPICNAIVWQSRQTADICDRLKADGYENLFQERTGLRIDPYFSGTKVQWMLDNTPGARELAGQGKLLCGTIDSWLIWKLSGQKTHVTDYTNASRTLLYNIYDCRWDEELCKILRVPMNMLPQVKDSSCVYAKTAPYHFFGHEIPIAGVAGDQQAALFGQGCTEEGMAKNTYGTGCFLLMNTGTKPHRSQHGLVTTIALGYHGRITYALEGSVFVAGSAVQWLRDQMEFFDKSSESEHLAEKASADAGIVVVPAFTGLGAPYWDDRARGTIFGLTRGTSRADLTKATLDSLAYQTKDVINAMQEDCGESLAKLRVDGGACANNYLMQFQSDILQCEVVRPKVVETTALGAAYLAGLAVGFWKDEKELREHEQTDREFKPQMNGEKADALYAKWKKAIAATRLFTEE